MKKRLAGWIALGLAAVLGLAGGAWILSLPPAASGGGAPPIANDEVEATLASLKPPRRARPLIAVVGVNEGTEVTDYLMTYGILRRADVADVLLLATKPGPVSLYPALRVEAQATLAEFDARHPDGADYVIVPAMHRDDDPTMLQWLRAQASRGAIVIGVCVGARVVAAAGLLDGRRATTHWYYLDDMLEKHPRIEYVRDRRLVVDRGVATTTGITASMPMMLTLIEAIGGRDRARTVGAELGLPDWNARHDSDAFRFTRPFALTVMGNRLAFWKHESLGLEVAPGVDEVTLALVADAWSRTYRSRAITFARDAGPLLTRGGVRLVPDRTADGWPEDERVSAPPHAPPALALDLTLDQIAARYGTRTAAVVAMQLEYPRMTGG
jgi:transcriptional regulator GlxA family with amidase domain